MKHKSFHDQSSFFLGIEINDATNNQDMSYIDDYDW